MPPIVYEVLSNEQKRRQYDHLISWPRYPRKTVVMEDVLGDDLGLDLDVIGETLQRFAEMGLVVILGVPTAACFFLWGSAPTSKYPTGTCFSFAAALFFI